MINYINHNMNHKTFSPFIGIMLLHYNCKLELMAHFCTDYDAFCLCFVNHCRKCTLFYIIIHLCCLFSQTVVPLAVKKWTKQMKLAKENLTPIDYY